MYKRTAYLLQIHPNFVKTRKSTSAFPKLSKLPQNSTRLVLIASGLASETDFRNSVIIENQTKGIIL
jgi:hypothetical protein